MQPRELPLPPHYDPSHVADWRFSPDQSRLSLEAQSWAAEHRIQPAGGDRIRIHLLLIDLQKDFCFPEGSLFVAGRSGTGAIDDSRRIAEFIYRNLEWITATTVTMDSHFPYQIFFPSFWITAKGTPPEAHTIVRLEDIESGRFRPNRDLAAWVCEGDYSWLEEQSRYYCAELERSGKYELYLWPYHCLLGSDGHALAGAVHEARLFHSFARRAQAMVEIKGDNWLTENYSVLRPEVLQSFDGRQLGQKNSRFFDRLRLDDAVIIAGQAASHCVANTIGDILDEIVAEDPALARKVYILEDCMSAVVVPGADFTVQASDALHRFAAAGMNVVRSTQPIAGWPGIAGIRPRS